MIYGDYYGIFENYNVVMEKVMGKEIMFYENVQLQCVFLFIYVFGVKGGVNYMYGGEIDVVLIFFYLVGIDSKEFI